MAEREGGGSKVLRGMVIAIVIVAGIILFAVFRRQALDGFQAVYDYVADHVPAQGSQRAAIVVYLVVAAGLGVLFSKAGHFTAYGIAMGLGPLLWVLFWEGFPLLGLQPTWTDSLGLDHLGPVQVAIFAVLAAVVITLVFVPLEIRENYLQRRHRLGESD